MDDQTIEDIREILGFIDTLACICECDSTNEKIEQKCKKLQLLFLDKIEELIS